MVKSRNEIKWEDAIITVVKECGGMATLKELYLKVPKIRGISPDSKTDHTIRAFLRRMSRISGKLKRIGLGIYALPDVELKKEPFDVIKADNDGDTDIFRNINDADLHSYIEGMLIELGNIYGYLTYTADPSLLFRGKPLREFATTEALPKFTYPELLSIAKTIDVIWLKRTSIAMPKHTFDVERTTDFSKAFHRAYQLRDFKISFYFISSTNKEDQFKRKLITDPYEEIRDRFFFRSFDDIASLYKTAIRHSELIEKILVEP